MPVRVGIDLASVDAVRDSIESHGARYLERVFSERELSDCGSTAASPEATADSEPHAGVDPERLAARFAAKEATLKVLRARDHAVPWRDIEVRREPSGSVELLLTGRAATLAEHAGITDLALSLTHEQGLASAVVVAELRPLATGTRPAADTENLLATDTENSPAADTENPPTADI
jgi:holo-[acyl-carrier protein] synthase